MICEICGKTTARGGDCDYTDLLFPDGERIARLRNELGRDCTNCGAGPGKVHHHGCDDELCPRCRMQLIGCGCGGPKGLSYVRTYTTKWEERGRRKRKKSRAGR